MTWFNRHHTLVVTVEWPCYLQLSFRRPAWHRYIHLRLGCTWDRYPQTGGWLAMLYYGLGFLGAGIMFQDCIAFRWSSGVLWAFGPRVLVPEGGYLYRWNGSWLASIGHKDFVA